MSSRSEPSWLIRSLERLANRWLELDGTNLGGLSNRIFGDSKRLRRVFSGEADLFTRSYERAVDWLSDNWPKDAAWPDEIMARPTRGED